MDYFSHSWYVFYTRPRAEKQVELILKKQGIITFLPLHLTRRVWSDRIKMIETPLFSSYIFVYTKESNLLSLLKTNGICRIVYHDNSPAQISNKEIESIRKFLEIAKEQELNYVINEEVLIASGPMRDISGKIKKIGKKFVILHLEQLGMTICVGQKQIVKVR